MLAKKEVNDVSVVYLCRTLNCSRNAFYKRFSNKMNFLTLCLIQNIQDEMKKHKRRGLNDSFYHLLQHLQRERMYYENMFRILGKTCICDLLQEKLCEFFWNKMELKESIAQLLVKELTNLIYGHLFVWITHDCHKDMQLVYRELETILNRLNHLKEDPSFIKKLRSENYHYLWGDKEFEE
ncbi:hypothetical protein [Lactobacillus sp. PV034]|uniref:hypothetical protein n=1 Tax=Lactobacillus sp. PV034 TaxID=2594495 RepID=UPI00224022BB|nr:hypothetical protein [Lactobacillus sp. PV034]QNQ80701.1 TetR/AcrR family transcriptional regulator [Lactobacillus sp. PV034]